MAYKTVIFFPRKNQFEKSLSNSGNKTKFSFKIVEAKTDKLDHYSDGACRLRHYFGHVDVGSDYFLYFVPKSSFAYLNFCYISCYLYHEKLYFLFIWVSCFLDWRYLKIYICIKFLGILKNESIRAYINEILNNAYRNVTWTRVHIWLTTTHKTTIKQIGNGDNNDNKKKSSKFANWLKSVKTGNRTQKISLISQILFQSNYLKRQPADTIH